jgi:hypothetical protein
MAVGRTGARRIKHEKLSSPPPRLLVTVLGGSSDLRTLASAYPNVPVYRTRLADSLRRLARLKLDAGDAAGAIADTRRAVSLFEGLPSPEGRERYWLTCARATLAAAAGRGGVAPSAAEAHGLADRAMDDLRQAIAAGYRSPAVYRHELALDQLRGRDDFQLLMMDLAMPAAPFAAAR